MTNQDPLCPQALTAALCWFTIGGALAVNNLRNDGIASSLYRNTPSAGVYASGAPYGAYSFQVPLAAAPKATAAASRVIPVKEQNYSFQNMNSYLKDSYGNRFVDSKQSPQSVSFKPFPQQFIQLQELPAHFAQPLPAPSFAEYKQPSPQIIVGSHYRLPLQNASPIKQQFGFPQGIYAGNIKSLAPQSISPSHFHGRLVQLPVPSQPYILPGQSIHYGSNVIHNQPGTPSPTAQQQSTRNEAIYANTQSEEQYHHNEEPKFQRLQEAPREESSEEETPEPPHQIVHHSDKTEQKVPVRETTITSFMNGQKTRVNLKTRAPLPLLDISLLEPLTFDNPLVPQVQHFLPKISEATYHKLPEFTQNGAKKHHKSTQKTKSYDSGNDKVKPKKITPKKKQRYPLVEIQNSYYDEVPSASTVRPVITVKGTPNESPEFSYEINSPNYKETYKEQAINYNKETNSEPVHYTYGTQKHEEPVHYTYVHSSKEPVHVKEIHYEGKGEGPKHLVHKFKSNEHRNEKQHESEDSGESSEEHNPRHHHNDHRDHNNEHGNHKHHENHNQHREHQNQDHVHQNHHHDKHNQHHETSKQSPHQKPEHKEQEYHHNTSPGSHQNQHDDHNPFKPIQYYTKTSSGSFHPVSEYEEEIRIAAPIKVNPNQHVQPQPESRQQKPSPPQQHNYQSPASPHRSVSHHNPAQAPHQKHQAPTAHVQEKTKTIIIQEETPEHSDDERSLTFGREEDKEKDFENAYKNAAFGFPAYEKMSHVEKDIYDPDNYGVSRDHSNYDFKNSPFQQYHDQSDNFPKNSRLSYKDTMDKMKEDYFLDYAISKPESLTDHYKKKVDYYKLYKHQKPEKYVAHEDESQKKQKASEKYTAIPYNFYPTQDLSMKQFMAQYKPTPFVQEFDYSKGVPRDNSAHSTQPYHRYKSNTFFVEPQFQYGFEPVSIPRLLDSELATMASNDSPESKKPGMRKKLYKENFYVKKTSLSDAGHSS